MKKFLLTILLTSCLFSYQLQGQSNSLKLDQLRWTNRIPTVRQMISTDRFCYHFYKNGIEMTEGTDFTVAFYFVPGNQRGGVYHLSTEFGFFAPGDIFSVRDDCSGESDTQVVLDDFAYLEVPDGTSYSGNGINANSSNPPYNQLTTPLNLGKCETVNVNAHVLFPIYIGLNESITTGPFKINGQAITVAQFDQYDAGAGSVYHYNTDGSITTSDFLNSTTKAFYSGQSMVSVEYTHNGVQPSNDITMALGGVMVRFIRNDGFSIWKRNYLGEYDIQDFTGDYANASYKITFDESSYKVYVNNTLLSTLDRFVVYGATGGSISNTAVLSYKTGVTYTPSSSGNQKLTALIDGAVTTFQKISVVDDITITPTLINVACSGGNTGKFIVSQNGGKSPFSYALDNGAYGNSNTFNNLSAGSYTIKVKDASGCVVSKSVTIGENAPLLLTISAQTNPSCSVTGSVSLSVTNGLAPFNYSLDGTNYQSSATFSSLGEGTYTFYVKDGNNCIKTTSTTLTTSSNLQISVASKQDISCYGGTNGQVTLSTIGAAGTLSYSMDGITYQSSPTFTGLSANLYTFYIKDDYCTKNYQVSLSQPSDLSINPQMTHGISCFGLQDGALRGTASGGVLPYSYSLDNTTFSTSNTFNNLVSGTYKVWVKDGNNCLKSSSLLTLSQPANLVSSLKTKVDVSCNGGSNGSVSLHTVGGTAPYQYFIGSTNYGLDSTLSSLTASTYEVTVKDANQCQTSVSAQILQPVALSLSSAINQQVSCNGGTNGAFTLSATGGTGVYQYSIDGGLTFGSNSFFSNLSAATYSASVQDANGCRSSFLPVGISEPSAIALSSSNTSVSCYGGNNGQLVAHATGGVGTYLYSLDGGNYGSSNTFPNLRSGTYRLSVKDGNTCVKQANFTISQPTSLVSRLRLSSDVSCFGGQTGSVVAYATGGTSPYQFSLDGTHYTSDSSFNSLTASTYTVWVKDANLCQTTTNTTTVREPNELLLSLSSISHVNCKSGTDGSMTFNATGGTTNYSYSKDGGLTYQTSSSFSNLASNTYHVWVKDAHACTKTLDVTLTQPTADYTLSIASKTDLSCYQNQTGELSVNHAGGTSPYLVSLDNITFQSNTSFTGLSAGTYTLYGKDAHNCRTSLGSVNLSEPTDIEVRTLMKKDVDCDYYTKGEAKVLATGSNGNFTYFFTGFDSQQRSIIPQENTTGYFQELAAGDYRVNAVDQRGCAKNYTVTIIPKNSKITFSTVTQVPSTCLAADGSITVTDVQGGRGNYTFNLSGTNTFSNQPSFTNLLNGNYVITVSDELCYYRKNISLPAAGAIQASYQLVAFNCNTPNANLIVDSVTGGNGNYQYSLNGATSTNNPVFSNLSPNVYSVVINDVPLSCKTNLSVEIKEQNRADLQVLSKTNISCYGGSNGQIVVSGNNNQNPFLYALDKGSWMSSGTFDNLKIGTYKVTASNKLGCLDSVQVSLTQPPLLNASLSKRDNLCFEDKSGEIYVSSHGGVSPYAYSLDDQNYQPLSTFSELKKGDYYVSVRDANNCKVYQSISLIQPTQVQVSPLYQDTIRCYGESNGRIAVIAAGGTPGYQYSLDGVNYVTESLFGGLKKNTYRLFVKDAHACVRSIELSITEPTPLTSTLVLSQNPLCYQSSDGQLVVSASGGNGGNTYELVNLRVAQNSPSFTALPEGTYNVKVSDRKQCTSEVSAIVLKHPTKIITNVASTMPLCFGDSNGKIALSPSGGTAGYRVEYQKNNYQQDINPFIFNELKAGKYTFYVRDSHACVDTVSYLLAEPSALQKEVTIKPNDCFGDKTGKITAMGLQASPPYHYRLVSKDNDGILKNDTLGIFGQLQAGKYLLDVFDSHECKVSAEVEVKQPSQVELSPLYQDTIRCYGERNGSIRILARGGTPSYLYSTDSTLFFTDSTFRNLGKGAYHFWVKDANACLAKTSLSITEPNLLMLKVASISNPLCMGESNGVVNLASEGGNGGNVYWQDNALNQFQNPRFEGLTEGDYTFKVVDRKGCFDTVPLAHLSWPKALAAKVQTQKPICYGTASALLKISPTGGVGSYFASLQQVSSGTLKRSKSSVNSFQFDSLQAGNYKVVLSDQNGCKLNLSTSLSETDSIEHFVLGTRKGGDTLCIGQNVTLDVKNQGKTIRWSYNHAETSNEVSNRDKSIYTVNTAGLYSVSVSNNTGCVVRDSFQLVNNNKALKAEFILPTQAFVGDTVVMLDFTKPIPDKVIWLVPTEAYITQKDNARCLFIPAVDGEMRLGMIAHAGACENITFRTIKIFRPEDVSLTDSAYAYKSYPISNINIYPNPNQGVFSLTITTKSVTDIQMKLVRVTNGEVVHEAILKPQSQVANTPNTYLFDLSLATGLYTLVLEAGKQKISKQVLVTSY